MESTGNLQTKKTRSPRKTNPVPAEAAHIEPRQTNAVDDKKYTSVTSLNLKRSFIKDPKHCKMLMSEDSFRSLIIAGVKNGVTWDEVLRALIDRENVSNEPFAGLENYLL